MIQDKHIEQLLDRFLKGTTTLEEEARLANYFRTHQVPDEWNVYQDMFAMFDRGEVEVCPEMKDERLEMKDEVTFKRKPIFNLLSLNSHLKLWRVAGIAAVIALMLVLPFVFKETTRQPEQPKLMAKADSVRTQRVDSAKADKGIPEKVIREMENIKHKMPRHLMAKATPKPQPVTSDEDLPTTGVTRQEPPAVEDDINREQLRNLAETYSRMSLEEYLAAMAKQEEEEVKAIRQRGKELERSMMANIPEMY